MARAVFARKLNALYPAEPEAEQLLHSVGQGELVMVEIRRPRNVYHHRKFFALLNLVYENQEHFKSVDELLAALKLALGYVTIVRTKRFGEIAIPKSINFATMDQPAFEQFYNRAVDFIVAEVIPGLNKQELAEQIAEFAA